MLVVDRREKGSNARLEQGEHLRRRDEILAELGVRAESGAQPGNANAAKNEGDKLSPSFRTTADIAAEVGLSERDEILADLGVRAEVGTNLANLTGDNLSPVPKTTGAAAWRD